jgi:hypothetical protein
MEAICIDARFKHDISENGWTAAHLYWQQLCTCTTDVPRDVAVFSPEDISKAVQGLQFVENKKM